MMLKMVVSQWSHLQTGPGNDSYKKKKKKGNYIGVVSAKDPSMLQFKSFLVWLLGLRSGTIARTIAPCNMTSTVEIKNWKSHF